MRATTRLLGAWLSTMALGCNLDKAPVGPRGLAFDESLAPAAPLVLHVIAPQATDPAIDRFLDDHYVWLDTTARTNHKLFVFLPGTVVGSATPQRPAQFQLVQQEAAQLGYHVIGLMYVNSGGIAQACPTDPDPAACYENARLEVMDGIDRSPIVDVNAANSIDNRLTKLLEYLAAQYPDEGWSRFLAHDKPKWSQIAISGHSGGGGFAAMIAKVRVVARVVLFAAVTDSIGTQSVPWVTTHQTPSDRYYGLAHDRDSFFRPIRASWDSLGMAASGGAVPPETSEPPYGLTHMLVTDLLPRGGFVGNNARGSVSNDANTPLNRARRRLRRFGTRNDGSGCIPHRSLQPCECPPLRRARRPAPRAGTRGRW